MRRLVPIILVMLLLPNGARAECLRIGETVTLTGTRTTAQNTEYGPTHYIWLPRPRCFVTLAATDIRAERGAYWPAINRLHLIMTRTQHERLAGKRGDRVTVTGVTDVGLSRYHRTTITLTPEQVR